MATTTLELMIFLLSTRTPPGENDLYKYAGELMAGAERIFAPYDIRLSVWPPDRGPYQSTTVPQFPPIRGTTIIPTWTAR